MSSKEDDKKIQEMIAEKFKELAKGEKEDIDIADRVLQGQRSCENLDKVVDFYLSQGIKKEYIDAIVEAVKLFLSPSLIPPLDEEVIKEETEKFKSDPLEYGRQVFGNEILFPYLKNPERYSKREHIKMIATLMSYASLLESKGFPHRSPDFPYMVFAFSMLIKICLRSIAKTSS